MHDQIKKWVDEIILVLASFASGVTGSLVIINEWLQAIAFIVSIAAGLLTIRNIVRKKEGNKNEGKKGDDGGHT